MRCCTCDRVLSDYEATLKHANTQQYLDMCVKCLKGLSIPTQDRSDLLGAQQAVEGGGASEDADAYMHYDESFNDDMGPMFDDAE